MSHIHRHHSRHASHHPRLRKETQVRPGPLETVDVRTDREPRRIDLPGTIQDTFDGPRPIARRGGAPVDRMDPGLAQTTLPARWSGAEGPMPAVDPALAGEADGRRRAALASGSGTALMLENAMQAASLAQRAIKSRDVGLPNSTLPNLDLTPADPTPAPIEAQPPVNDTPVNVDPAPPAPQEDMADPSLDA